MLDRRTPRVRPVRGKGCCPSRLVRFHNRGRLSSCRLSGHRRLGRWSHVAKERSPIQAQPRAAAQTRQGADARASAQNHGAERTEREELFESTPSESARYYGHPEVAGLIDGYHATR